MRAKDLKYVKNCINKEGFDYCFCDYSDFETIKDVEFHILRVNYQRAAEALKDYLYDDEE